MISVRISRSNGARAWFRVGTVTVDGEKMAKSADNLVLVRDLLQTYPAAVVRLAIIDRPWAQPWEYAPGVLDVAAARLEDLHQAAGRRVGHTDEAGVAQLRQLLEAGIPRNFVVLPLRQAQPSIYAANLGDERLVASGRFYLGVSADIDRGELTDKGTVSHMAVLANRGDLVEELYAKPYSPRVLVA